MNFGDWNNKSTFYASKLLWHAILFMWEDLRIQVTTPAVKKVTQRQSSNVLEVKTCISITEISTPFSQSDENQST